MEIALATARGRRIPNSQAGELTSVEGNALDQLIDKYGARKRGSCTVQYNCHGLTFASRRTGIDDSQSVLNILEDDGYEPIAPLDALPGDVVVYIAPDTGDIEHSGVLLKGLDATDTLKPAVIVSKWSKGPEAIHNVNRCPYNPSAVRYYRIKSSVGGSSGTAGGDIPCRQYAGISLPPFQRERERPAPTRPPYSGSIDPRSPAR